MDDKQLLLLLRDNPSDGLRELIDRYGGLLTAVVSRILKNSQDVEECVADAFIGIWKAVLRFEKPDNLKGYLLCSARNNAVNRYHQLNRQNSSSGCIETIPDEDMELMIIRNDLIDKLQRQIMKMPPPNRDIFIRKYFLFESVKDIAAEIGLSEAQVKARLYRGRKNIRKAFEERGCNDGEIIFETSW